MSVSTDLRPEGGQSTQDPGFVPALRGVVLRPDAFFAGLAPRAALARATVFALVCIAISTMLAWVATGADDPVGTGLVVPLAFDLVFFAAYVGLTHLMVLVFARHQQAGWGATFRIVAFSQVSQLINWIPTVGLTIGFVYGSVLAILGIRHLHRADTGPAVAAVLVPVAVVGGVALVVIAVMSWAAG